MLKDKNDSKLSLEEKRLSFQYRLTFSFLAVVFVLSLAPILLTTLGRRVPPDSVVNTLNQNTILLTGGFISAMGVLVGFSSKKSQEESGLGYQEPEVLKELLDTNKKETGASTK